MAGPADAILSRRSESSLRLFTFYLRWHLGRSFHGLRLSRAGLPTPATGQPLIVYSNHPSWWDPAVYILLSRMLFPSRASYGPMDQAALGRYRLLERMGVFGVPQHDTRGAAQFLRVCRAVLDRPGTMLWITAEGSFTDNRSRPISLRPGLAHLVRRLPGAVILPLALDYPFWNESRPEALVRFGSPLTSGPGSVAEWTARLEAALTETLDALATESVARDAALFKPLLRGSAGAGLPYDSWRWLRATAAGRRFDRSHGSET